MLPSVLAFRLPYRHETARHNLACGFIDFLACKHCRKSRVRYQIIVTQKTEDLPNKLENMCSDKTKKSWWKFPQRGMKSGSDWSQEKQSRPLSCHEDPMVSEESTPSFERTRRRSYSFSDVDVRNSILKRDLDEQRRLKNDGTVKKQARFCEMVSVIVHDPDGNRLGENQVKLKESVAQTIPSSPSNNQVLVTSSKAPFKLECLEVNDAENNGHLRAFINLGEGFVSDKIELHSARMGLALAVIAYRPEPLGDGSLYYKRYSQRFGLPQPIDPYSIQAVMVAEGYIRIHANLID